MDDVKVCKRCGRLFQAFRQICCPKCEIELDDIFERARDYIYNHPHENMISLAKALDEKEADILYLVREGRLSFDTAEGSGILCEQCGRPVASGRVCDECRNSVFKSLEEMAARDRLKNAPQQSYDRNKIKGSSYIDEIARRDR